MKRFNKIYLEISNVCNLRCAFCPGTKRAPRVMSEAEFSSLLPKLRPWTDYLYFHLMGEPLCHPQLERFLALAGEAGFKVILTTNGTLLPRQQEMLLHAPGLYKVNVSLHAFEANDLSIPFADYLDGCFAFGKAAEGRVTVSYRLWNSGGADKRNEEILRTMEQYFPRPWKEEKLGPRIGNRIYLQHGEKFDWPDLESGDRGGQISCYGLRDQIGILCDGTVVPCCLDHEGDIALGNLFAQELDEILNSPRAKSIRDGFVCGNAVEELCRKCGYAQQKFS
jgi:radical SAM protein with 4Fe4S-binding SPASM domain